MKPQQTERQLKIGTPLMRLALILVFAAVIIAADLCLVLSHERTFSENENRVLQQLPAVDMDSVVSGRFMNRAEQFVTDQFVLRDVWIEMKLLLERISGRKQSNGIWLGRNDYLLEMPVKPNEAYLQRNIAAINAFAERYDVNVVMSLIPGAAWVCDQLLPANAPCEDVGRILADIRASLAPSVRYADVSQTLRDHRTEELYYRSDHHWKSLGARYAFEAMADALSIDDILTEYAIMTVTNDFSGTMAAGSGAFYVKDSIEIYVPLTGQAPYGNEQSDLDKALVTDLEYVVEYTDTAEKSSVIYDAAALDRKDKYQVFLGGNHPLIRIRTNRDNNRHLLLLKDSYANAFVQFLLPYYASIQIVDPRYYSDDLDRLMQEQGITDVLILYSENNFVTDNSLFGVLEDTL